MLSLNRNIINNNHLCPCGSKLKYKDCCKNKQDTLKIHPNKPLNVYLYEMMKKSLLKTCLHYDKSNCKGKIIRAHALQNNKILSELSVNDEVYVMNHKGKPTVIPVGKADVELLVEFVNVPVNKATVSTCFCKKHDDEVFAPIEKQLFEINNEEQKFIYAYKAFIFEYYKELVREKQIRNLIKEKPSVLKQKMFIKYLKHCEYVKSDMTRLKNFFDKGIANNNYSGLNTIIIKFDVKIKFSNFACIGFNYDLTGKRIRNLRKDIMRKCMVTIFSENSHSYMLLSYLDEDSIVYDKLGKQLSSFNKKLIEYYLSLYLPLYSENIVLSPSLWNHWTSEQQMAFTFLCNRHTNQAYTFDKMFSFHLKNIAKKKIVLTNDNKTTIDLFV